MELGDAAAWTGCVVALLSFGWHVTNEARARAAGRQSRLKARVTMASDDRAFIEWRAADIGEHTTAKLRIKVRSPSGAALVQATVTGPLDDLRYYAWGEPSRGLLLDLLHADDHLWCRTYVVGLEANDTPFVLDVVMMDGSTGKPLLKRRKWPMRASRPAIKLEPRRH
ncbi:hypothetical protein JIX59_08795 [Brevundimonas diminuta]|uniref:hypothetical protein n=1 Tax=Brevundimonas diminuta TaxID=293 RepID=UPI0019075A82|nr:hypothetical protein [Brevundimonas diminuta]MBK1969431.1 hypothetical protein [Brevundimonas diminuta]